MLTEVIGVRQIPQEGFRRWFTDVDMDLVIWYRDETLGEILGFQLSYDKKAIQMALTWTAEEGYRHNRIDDGEEPMSNKMTPVLMAATGFDLAHIQGLFQQASATIDPALICLVTEHLVKFDQQYRARQARKAT